MSSFLLLSNLGNQYLWQDEAQTALIGKTILTDGVPRGYDGKNYFSQELGAEYGKEYIWKWHTWLPFYIVALSFKLLGTNTFAARFPFVLFGIGSIFLTYYFTIALYKDRSTARVAVILLLTSVPFLLLSKQCRYYSPAIFFSLLSLHAYLKILENKRRGTLIFLVSSTLLFHTHFVYCAIILTTIFINSVIFHKEKIIKMLMLSTLIVFLNLPWIVWLSTMKYSERYITNIISFPLFLDFFKQYVSQIFGYIIPPFMLLILLLITAYAWHKKHPLFTSYKNKQKNMYLLIIYLISNIMVLSLFSPYPFFRYLGPSIPVLIIITSHFITFFAQLISRFSLNISICII